MKGIMHFTSDRGFERYSFLYDLTGGEALRLHTLHLPQYPPIEASLVLDT
jgi:hypothetical protein